LCPTEKRTVAWIQSFLELHGLQIEGGEGPDLPHPKKKSQLEPSREGENMKISRGEPIQDVMKEDQRQTE
jgi:hypothetical protein